MFVVYGILNMYISYSQIFFFLSYYILPTFFCMEGKYINTKCWCLIVIAYIYNWLNRCNINIASNDNDFILIFKKWNLLDKITEK